MIAVAEWLVYLLIAACLIGSAVWVTAWYCGQRADAVIRAGVAEAFAAGRASYAEEMEARRRAVHAIGRTGIASTVVLSRQRKTGVAR